MKRTSLVLVALTCATIGLTAEQSFAQYNRDQRGGYGYVTERDVEAARCRLEESERNHVAARRCLDQTVVARHQITSQIGEIQRSLADAAAQNDRYHAIERLRRDLADAEARWANHDRNLRNVARSVEAAEREVRAAEDAFFAIAKRDPAYHEAADRVAQTQRHLDRISNDITYRLESTREWRALVSERDEAIERLDRVSGHQYIGVEYVNRARQAVDDAENRLNRLRDRVLSEDPQYRAASAELDGEQSQLDYVWNNLKRGLYEDADYRRATSNLDSAQRDLAETERCVNVARAEVDNIARELQRYGDRYIAYVDVNALQRNAARFEQQLCEIDLQINRGQRAVEQTECEVVEARREYQRVLAEFNRSCADSGRVRDRGGYGDRGNRYGRP